MTNERFDDEWKIKHGVLPSFENKTFAKITHPADVAVFEAMKMCFSYYYDGVDDGGDLVQGEWHISWNEPIKLQQIKLTRDNMMSKCHYHRRGPLQRNSLQDGYC